MPGILSTDLSNDPFGHVSPECERPAPVPLEDEPSVPDSCYVVTPLIDSEKKGESHRRLIRFDRRGDSFVLSPKNSEAEISWVQSFSNRPDILQFIEDHKRKAEYLRNRELTVKDDSPPPDQVFLDLDFSTGIRFFHNEAGFLDASPLFGAKAGFDYF